MTQGPTAQDYRDAILRERGHDGLVRIDREARWQMIDRLIKANVKSTNEEMASCPSMTADPKTHIAYLEHQDRITKLFAEHDRLLAAMRQDIDDRNNE